jgi:hypothetical protein
MIVTDLDLRRELARATASGRLMVLISYVDEKEKKLRHYSKTIRFPREDIPGSLNKYAEMLEEEAQGIEKDPS